MADETIRVLFVEDSRVHFELVARHLKTVEAVEFRLTHVTQLSDGLQHLSTGRFDVVLLDLNLPDSYGLETFQRIRAGAPDVPVIVLTGIDDENIVLQTAREGAQDILVKGQTDRELLVRTLRYAIERNRLQTQLKEQAAALETTNRELKQFAYVASHDLQEPLRKILAFGERLTTKYGQDLAEQGRDYVQRMQNAALRMQALIDDLLVYSRVTTRANPFVSVDLGEVVEEVVSDLEVRIERTGGRVLVEQLPAVEADPIQMRQLFQNLIGNALKFHVEEQKPLVEVSAVATDRKDDSGQPILGNGQCQIAVRDNGIGIDPKYSDRIFGVFQRLHSRGSYEGTGIGLAICRKIVERHGGTITATSELGSGATFVVALPIQQSMQGAAQ